MKYKNHPYLTKWDSFKFALIFAMVFAILVLCACNPCKNLQQGDKVNIGSVHGIVIKNDYGERRILILINSNRGVLFVAPENTYQIFDYKEIR